MTGIGVIGLGNMGRGMALTLKRAGYRVLGFDVLAPTRAALSAEGIETSATIAEPAVGFGYAPGIRE